MGRNWLLRDTWWEWVPEKKHVLDTSWILDFLGGCERLGWVLFAFRLAATRASHPEHDGQKLTPMTRITSPGECSSRRVKRSFTKYYA